MDEELFKSVVFEDGWRNVERPGYFGRRRDMKVAAYDEIYGKGNWRLAWVYRPDDLVRKLFGNTEAVTDARISKSTTKPEIWTYDFVGACQRFYEESYVKWLYYRPAEIAFVCSFGECIDNAPTNVNSGFDYSIQESYSTHIQDIAMRNALRRLGKKFEGPADKILVIRSKDSEGFRFGPGNVLFFEQGKIIQPSKCPDWANAGSVEDFWQSNKWLQVKVS